MVVFYFVAPAIKINSKSILTCFQQFILVIKLRLNTGNQDLAYRFCVSQATVARMHKTMIGVLYAMLGSLVGRYRSMFLRNQVPPTPVLLLDV